MSFSPSIFSSPRIFVVFRYPTISESFRALFILSIVVFSCSSCWFIPFVSRIKTSGDIIFLKFSSIWLSSKDVSILLFGIADKAITLSKNSLSFEPGLSSSSNLFFNLAFLLSLLLYNTTVKTPNVKTISKAKPNTTHIEYFFSYSPTTLASISFSVISFPENTISVSLLFSSYLNVNFAVPSLSIPNFKSFRTNLLDFKLSILFAKFTNFDVSAMCPFLP